MMALAHDIEKWNVKGKGLLITISVSNYIIFLFHTTFEGFAKAIVHKVPMFADTSNEMLFVVNVSVVVLCGVVCPIVLHRYVLNKSSVTKVLFGSK